MKYAPPLCNETIDAVGNHVSESNCARANCSEIITSSWCYGSRHRTTNKALGMAGTLTKFSKTLGQISSKSSNFAAPVHLSQHRNCKYGVLVRIPVKLTHDAASSGNDFWEHQEASIW